jgi:hypothetical protein
MPLGLAALLLNLSVKFNDATDTAKIWIKGISNISPLFSILFPLWFITKRKRIALAYSAYSHLWGLVDLVRCNEQQTRRKNIPGIGTVDY